MQAVCPGSRETTKGVRAFRPPHPLMSCPRPGWFLDLRCRCRRKGLTPPGMSCYFDFFFEYADFSPLEGFSDFLAYLLFSDFVGRADLAAMVFPFGACPGFTLPGDVVLL